MAVFYQVWGVPDLKMPQSESGTIRLGVCDEVHLLGIRGLNVKILECFSCLLKLSLSGQLGDMR